MGESHKTSQEHVIFHTETNMMEILFALKNEFLYDIIILKNTVLSIYVKYFKQIFI